MAVKFIENTPLSITRFLGLMSKKERKGVSRDDQMDILIELLSREKNHFASICRFEKQFIKSGKPFFNVYPKVLESLSKTKMDISPSSIEKSEIHKLSIVSIKLPVGSKISNLIGADSFFVSIIDGEFASHINSKFNYTMLNGKAFAVATVVGDGSGPLDRIQISVVPFDGKWDDKFSFEKQIDGSLTDSTNLMCRIALGVMMLAADPDYIKPVLLKADEGKTTPIEERIARAKNRGVYGFTIGEEIERCPHFRRPHFAIRWTGKGGEIPKLVPVKGAVIGKGILTTVPTGYEEG